MKPTSHSTGQNRPSDAKEVRSDGFPVTDFNYQSVTLDEYRGGCANIRAGSFRNISNDYFKNEARHSFVTEAVFFALIVVTSTWPILQSVRAMADLVRAFSGI